MITIRLAQAEDRAGILHIAARTWGGDDYLPDVLDDWLVNPNGRLYVALDDTATAINVVGVARLTRIGEGEWWLEGIRVEPDRYGQGIGRLLHEHLLREAETVGSGVLRLATGSTNTAIHKLAGDTGFVLAGRYVMYRANSVEQGIDQSADVFRMLTEPDLSDVRSFLNQSPYYQYASFSMEQSWKWTRITDERLLTRMEQSEVHGWLPNGDRLDGVIIVNPPEQPEPGHVPILNIGYLDARAGELATMAQAVRGLAARLGYRKMQTRFVARGERLVAMEQAGWRRRGSDELWLFSRDLPGVPSP